MNKPLIGVDEFNIVFLPQKRCSIEEWEQAADKIVEDVFDLALLERVFDGRLSRMQYKIPAGYTTGYDVGEKDFYFAVAYNENKPDMAVCMRFSAKAWAVYQSRYCAVFGEYITLPALLILLDNNLNETVRISKIDLTADYFDAEINLDALYQGLKTGEIVVKDQDNWTRLKKFKCFENNQHVETIYIGSQKGNSRGFLRIYDKRAEQLETNGFRTDEALKCKEWIRFEAVFKGIYAHNISKKIIADNMDTTTFARYIAFCITSKYRFYKTTEEDFLNCTKELIALIESADFDAFRVESPRDNSLHQNIQHIEHGSGFYPTLYKIEKLYGEKAVDEFLQYLTDQYHDGKWISRSMHAELSLWLKKHADLKTTKLEDNY